MQSLKLRDIPDRDLLGILHDCADNEGWSSSSDIAKRLKMKGKHTRSSVGIRLSWMKSYGVVESEPYKGKARWRLSPIGEILMNGELKAAQKKLLQNMPHEQILMLTRFIGQRYSKAPDTVGHMMRREWMFHHLTRK